MNELIKRSLTGILFIAVILGTVHIHPAAFAGVLLVFAVLALREFYGLAGKGRTGRAASNSKAKIHAEMGRSYVVTGLAAGTIVFLLVVVRMAFVPVNELLWGIPAALALIPVAALLDRDHAGRNLLLTCTGIAYVIGPFSLLFLMLYPVHAGTDYETGLVTGFFVIQWTYDTGAYVTGRAIGRHSLAPVLSPAKTWEGLGGGVLWAAIAAFLIARWSELLTQWDWFAVCAIIIAAGTFGDLFESALKRKAGIKESGTILPGHGGVLDRFDSVLFSVPAVTIYYLIRSLN